MNDLGLPPTVLERLLYVLVKEFKLDGKEAARAATKLVVGLREQDMAIVPGSLMRQRRGIVSWEDLAFEADRLERARGGIKPWNPPELQ